MTLPVFRSIVPYQRSWLQRDLIAGITVWAVLVPEALAYASIAGVSPVVGLYAARHGIHEALLAIGCCLICFRGLAQFI